MRLPKKFIIIIYSVSEASCFNRGTNCPVGSSFDSSFHASSVRIFFMNSLLNTFVAIIHFIKGLKINFDAKKTKTSANWWQRSEKNAKYSLNYAMGSGQKSLRLQDLQCLPIHTSSNWFIACSTISGASVKMTASKLRVVSAFIPIPAPVRFALPIYTSLQSKTSILK